MSNLGIARSIITDAFAECGVSLDGPLTGAGAPSAQILRQVANRIETAVGDSCDTIVPPRALPNVERWLSMSGLTEQVETLLEACGKRGD